MNEVENLARFRRLLDAAGKSMQLDLHGLAVLTEAASGYFICTPLLAALAGARVFAVTCDSRYGAARDVIAYGERLAAAMGVSEKITFTAKPPAAFAGDADIITNLGFVRPIAGEFARNLQPHAVISLMWEPWEIRDGDIDFDICKSRGNIVVATNEHDPRLQTMTFVGATALKLVLESDVEVFGSEILVVGSDPFGTAIATALTNAGASVHRSLPPFEDLHDAKVVSGLDAVVVAEHRSWDPIIGSGGKLDVERLKQAGTALVYIAGNIDVSAVNQAGIPKVPPGDARQGFMSVSAAYVGPKPVIDLHAAGLRVGCDAVRARLGGADVEDAIRAAEASGLGLRIPGWP